MNKRFNFDKEKAEDFDYLIGTDEAGRGPGAGPVFAAAVCFISYDKQLEKLNDSKQLSEKVREELFEIIKQNSVYSIAQGSVEEIEQLNILRTSLLSMKRCCSEVIKKINSEKVKILIDGNKKIPNFTYNQEAVIKGDFKSASIAAASILAKVSRDRYMDKIHLEFPQYDWHKNKGYLTKTHINAIQKYGATKYHRLSFLKNIIKTSE